MNKEEVLAEVDSCGDLVFDHWYKNTLTYKNRYYKVVFRPEYRDHCDRVTTLQELLCCEDYTSVDVYIDGETRPLTNVFSKKGDMY